MVIRGTMEKGPIDLQRKVELWDKMQPFKTCVSEQRERLGGGAKFDPLSKLFTSLNIS